MTAVIVGRFQVPYLHLGHIYLISHCLQKFGTVGILLGTTLIRDEKNPYSIEHREDIIHRIFPQIRIYTLWDIPHDDKKWSISLNELCFAHFTSPYFLCHSRDSFKDHYKGTLDLYEVPELPGYSGTELRKP
jgi:nicotinamide mononucleotide adenylyltransferase